MAERSERTRKRPKKYATDEEWRAAEKAKAKAKYAAERDARAARGEVGPRGGVSPDAHHRVNPKLESPTKSASGGQIVRDAAQGTTRAMQRLAEREERRTRVMQLLLAGCNYRQIATALGCTKETVMLDVSHVRTQWREERIDDYGERVDEIERQLRTLLQGVWDEARRGNLNALDRAITLIKERARVIGVPKEQPPVEVTVNVGDPLEALESAYRRALESRGLLGVAEDADAGAAAPPDDRLALPGATEPAPPGRGEGRGVVEVVDSSWSWIRKDEDGGGVGADDGADPPPGEPDRGDGR